MINPNLPENKVGAAIRWIVLIDVGVFLLLAGVVMIAPKGWTAQYGFVTFFIAALFATSTLSALVLFSALRQMKQKKNASKSAELIKIIS